MHIWILASRAREFREEVSFLPSSRSFPFLSGLGATLCSFDHVTGARTGGERKTQERI
jgi:hypothetical protein